MMEYKEDIRQKIEFLISQQDYYLKIEDYETCNAIEFEIDRLSDLL